MSAAVRANGDLRVRELLDLFCALVALGAFIFVKWHGCNSFLTYKLIVFGATRRGFV